MGGGEGEWKMISYSTLSTLIFIQNFGRIASQRPRLLSFCLLSYLLQFQSLEVQSSIVCLSYKCKQRELKCI